MILRMSVIAFAALTLAACATPDPTASPGPMRSPFQTGVSGYLATGVIDGREVIGPPPAPDSPRGRADQAAFEALRAMEGSPRWAAAQADNDLWNGGAVKRYACAMGREINETSTPVTARMLHRIEMDVRTVGTPAKDFYARRRPALGNTLPICVPREPWMGTNASYPSGHAMTGWSWSLVLAEIRPADATALLEAGMAMGRSRVICGVHYESDVEAGRTLAAGMVARLHAEPAFLGDLAKAKRELAAAPPATGCTP